MKKGTIIKLAVIALIVVGMTQKVVAKDALEKGFTMKLAYVMPSATFGQMPSAMFIENPGSFGFVAKEANNGFGFQIGTMFYINAIDLGDQMKIGLDVTWLSLNYSSTTYVYKDEIYFINGSGQQFTRENGPKEANFYNMHFMMEFGPMFSYSPIEKMAIDASFKLSPTVGLMGGKADYSTGETSTVGGVGFGIRYTPAFYFRYNVFLVGFELNLGNINGTYGATGYSNWKGSTPYSTNRLVFGFKF